MTSIIAGLMEQYNYVLKEKSDPRVAEFPLMQSPVYILAIIAFYYYFIKYAGIKFMEKRKPFDLKKIMIVYNTAQCIVNAWATFQGARLLIHPDYSIICTPATHDRTPFQLKTTYLSYVYLIVKIVDLLDTVFMILRKNYHQVTFLHVYHHVGMAFGCWVVVKFIPGAHLCFVGFLNCGVHTIMYFYYLLTAFDSEAKKSIWWKKHITELQMVQFTLILIHHTLALLNPNCTYPKSALAIFVSQNILMVYLFSKFYYDTYIKPNKRKKD